jgi:hypothetical protein
MVLTCTEAQEMKGLHPTVSNAKSKAPRPKNRRQARLRPPRQAGSNQDRHPAVCPGNMRLGSVDVCTVCVLVDSTLFPERRGLSRLMYLLRPAFVGKPKTGWLTALCYFSSRYARLSGCQDDGSAELAGPFRLQNVQM